MILSGKTFHQSTTIAIHSNKKISTAVLIVGNFLTLPQFTFQGNHYFSIYPIHHWAKCFPTPYQ